MKFWDSSAIVPLLLPEPETTACKRLFAEDNKIFVWMFTPTEVWSAVYRKIREGKIAEGELKNIKDRMDLLQKGWSEVVRTEATRAKAHRLLAVHSLRAADVLQLAAALIAFDDHPEGEHFITFDRNLAQAAGKEGFLVFPGEGG